MGVRGLLAALLLGLVFEGCGGETGRDEAASGGAAGRLGSGESGGVSGATAGSGGAGGRHLASAEGGRAGDDGGCLGSAGADCFAACLETADGDAVPPMPEELSWQFDCGWHCVTWDIVASGCCPVAECFDPEPGGTCMSALDASLQLISYGPGTAGGYRCGTVLGPFVSCDHPAQCCYVAGKEWDDWGHSECDEEGSAGTAGVDSGSATAGEGGRYEPGGAGAPAGAAGMAGEAGVSAPAGSGGAGGGT